MSLNMYLSVRRSLCLKKGRRTINLDDKRSWLDGLSWDYFGVSNRITVEENACYWSNARAINQWFNEHRNDDGIVSTEDLRDLHSICKRILQMVSERKNCLKLNPDIRDAFDDEKPTYFRLDKDDLPNMLKSSICCYDINGKALTERFNDMLPSTDYDGLYICDVVKTVLMLDRLFVRIAEFEKNNSDYELIYRAS